jgi:hypothetical protein
MYDIINAIGRVASSHRRLHKNADGRDLKLSNIHRCGNVYGRAVNCLFTGEEASSANTSKGCCCFLKLALEELPATLLANHPIRQ